MEYFQQRQQGSSLLQGAPHHHIWAAMVLSTVNSCHGATLPPACRDDLTKLERHANSTESPMDLQDWVH
eukprot:15588861-Heterocapsa_arctica.AAC.1